VIPGSLKKKKNDTLDDLTIAKEEKKVVTINLDHHRPSIVAGTNATDRTPRRPAQLVVEQSEVSFLADRLNSMFEIQIFEESIFENLISEYIKSQN